MTLRIAPRRGSKDSVYFFLSYARSAPIPDSPQVDVDAWVRVFFEQLVAEVDSRSDGRAGAHVGFADWQLLPSSDPKLALTEALGRTQVFVPLYSPGYLAKAWTRGERHAFEYRIRTSTTPHPERHILPVLWTPFPSWRTTEEVDEALDIGRDVPDYTRNGLRALCMLTTYRSAYQELLGRIADRIVDVAEGSPIEPSPAGDIDGSGDPQQPLGTGVIVAVLSARRTPGLRSSDGVRWRPFGDRLALSAGQYAARIAERLGLAPVVRDFESLGPDADLHPVVVLIDARAFVDSARSTELERQFADLPGWVVPLLVSDLGDDVQPSTRQRQVARALQVLKGSHQTNVSVVTDVDHFVAELPTLLTRSRRAFLRSGPVHSASPSDHHQDDPHLDEYGKEQS